MANNQQQHSECLTFNKHRSAASQIRYQALKASFLKGVKCRVPGSLYQSLGPFSLFKNSSLADKIQFTFTSSLCTISSNFWWHTSCENIDTYDGKIIRINNHRWAIVVFPCLVSKSKLSLSLQGNLLSQILGFDPEPQIFLTFSPFHSGMNSLCHTTVSSVWFKICLLLFD